MNYRDDLLLEPNIAGRVVDGVRGLKPFWFPRPTGWTLGSSIYLDEPVIYPAMANFTNRILADALRPLYQSVGLYLQTLTGKEVITLPGVAIPGFHIFTEQSNGYHGHIHIDEPYERIEWPQEVTEPFSFTLALALPACGGGLKYWPGTKMYDKLGESVLLEYEVGHIYVHDGKTPHRIHSFGDMGEGESRVTLQGHCITMGGKLVMYF